MNDLKQALIDQARKQYGKIRPSGTMDSLEDCFSEEEGRLYFWFNVQGGNTKVLIEGRVV